MVKVKVLSRSESSYTRERADGVDRLSRNPDPLLHPFAKQREYTRALNSAKLTKIFAKPFITALEGHADSVLSLATSPKSLSILASGGAEGDLRVWDITNSKCMWSTRAHRGFVRSVAINCDGSLIYSCGDDFTVRSFSLESALQHDSIS